MVRSHFVLPAQSHDHFTDPLGKLELKSLDESKLAIVIEDEDTIADYYDLRQQLDILIKDLRDVLNHPTYALPFLQPGRLVRVKHDDLDFGWGCVVNYQKRLGPRVRSFLSTSSLPT
jgi:hypothetical protein